MKSLTTFLFYTLPLHLLLLLSSCGVLHKIFTKTKTQTDTEIQKTSDSTSVKKKDSSSLSVEDSSRLKKTEVLHQNGIEIHFTDSSETNTIEITTDAQGHQTIQAKGHIRSVSTRQRQSALHLDSSHYLKQNQSSYQMLDSTKAATKIQASLHEKTKTVSKDKKSSRLPWYGYTLLFFLVLLFIYLRFKNKIKEFFKL